MENENINNQNLANLACLFSPRSEKMTDDYGNHYIYNDGRKCYERVPKNRIKRHTVCNIESFSEAVTFNKNNHDSEIKPIVIFTESGAVLFCDERLDDDQDVWVFERKYTNLWNVVRFLIGKDNLNHKDLLNKLESIKNYVINFEDLYLKLAKLRVNKKITFASSPVFEEGEQSGSYEWEQKVSSGNTEKASCPSKISFRGKIVRGSEAVYDFDINLMPVIDEERGQILFKLFMPTAEFVLDQVREDEYSDFLQLIDEETKKATLILRDY